MLLLYRMRMENSKAQSTREIGNRNEEVATGFLERNGFRIVDRNFYAKKMGEIDIVAFKGGVLHFVEVKASKGSFDPIYNLTPTKLNRLIKAARYYMQTKSIDHPFCIDALVIRNKSIELIENITL